MNNRLPIKVYRKLRIIRKTQQTLTKNFRSIIIIIIKKHPQIHIIKKQLSPVLENKSPFHKESIFRTQTVDNKKFAFYKQQTPANC
jgi:hypothetical protein